MLLMPRALGTLHPKTIWLIDIFASETYALDNATAIGSYATLLTCEEAKDRFSLF